MLSLGIFYSDPRLVCPTYEECRCAVHGGLTTAQDRSLYDRLLATEVYRSTSIIKDVTLSVCGIDIVLKSATEYLHIEDKEEQLRLYVPNDEQRRETCYLYQLPEKLISHIGMKDPAMIKIFERIIRGPFPGTVADLLVEHDTIHVPGVDPVPPYDPIVVDDTEDPGIAIPRPTSEHAADPHTPSPVRTPTHSTVASLGITSTGDSVSSRGFSSSPSFLRIDTPDSSLPPDPSSRMRQRHLRSSSFMSPSPNISFASTRMSRRLRAGSSVSPSPLGERRAPETSRQQRSGSKPALAPDPSVQATRNRTISRSWSIAKDCPSLTGELQPSALNSSPRMNPSRISNNPRSKSRAKVSHSLNPTNEQRTSEARREADRMEYRNLLDRVIAAAAQHEFPVPNADHPAISPSDYAAGLPNTVFDRRTKKQRANDIRIGAAGELYVSFRGLSGV